MTNEIERLQAEVISLDAETLALQTLLFSLMVGLQKSGLLNSPNPENIFDGTINFLEKAALRFGKSAAHGHTVGAIKIVEDLRAQFFAS